jgi:hypothetical protein
MGSDLRIERMRRAIADAVDRQARIEEELRKRAGPPRPGHLYAPESRKDPVDWAVIQEHPDDPSLLFVVPADDFPLRGPSDVVVPDEAGRGPLVLRCGLGAWARSDYFAARRRVGELDPPALDAARKTLADMVRGGVEATDADRGDEDDPDYEDWMGLVEASRAALESALEELGLFLDLGEFRPGVPEGLPCGESEDGALWYGPLQFPDDSPGEIYLLADSRGLRALRSGEGKPPPIGVLGKSRRWRRERWIETAGATGCDETPLLPWPDGRIELRIGPGKGHRIAIDRTRSGPTKAVDPSQEAECEIVAVRFVHIGDETSDEVVGAAALAAAPLPIEGRKLELWEPLDFNLLGGAIKATLSLTESGGLEVAADTKESRYAGWTAEFTFQDRVQGQVLLSAQVTLEGGPAEWAGARVCEMTFAAPFAVRIRVRPPDGDRGNRETPELA